MNTEVDGQIIAETENFFVWSSEDEKNGVLYHLELGGVSLHIEPEEWNELVALIKSIP